MEKLLTGMRKTAGGTNFGKILKASFEYVKFEMSTKYSITNIK